MSQWRVLDLLHFKGEVYAKSGHVYIGDRSVALSDVSTILTGPDVKFSGSFINRACAFEVAVLPCDWKGVPISVLMPWSKHSYIGARYIAQASLSEPRRKNAWMRIVKAKIQ